MLERAARKAYADLERSLDKPGLADALLRIHDAVSPVERQAAVAAAWASFPDVMAEIGFQDQDQQTGRQGDV